MYITIVTWIEDQWRPGVTDNVFVQRDFRLCRESFLFLGNETNGGLNMARHKKCRQIGFTPRMLDFSPSIRTKFEIILNIDELEALRLTDSMKLDQTQAGVAMGVSRGTLQRILNSAHEKVADALLNGKKIRIVSDNTYYEWDA